MIFSPLSLESWEEVLWSLCSLPMLRPSESREVRDGWRPALGSMLAGSWPKLYDFSRTPLYTPFPVGEATPPCEKVALWDSGTVRVRSGEPLCANGWCSMAGEGEVEGGPEGVVAGVGGSGGGGVESLRLPLLLLLQLAWPKAGSSELWPNSSNSSREIFR